MSQRKAVFIVDDMIVKVECLTCGTPQHSPNYPNSLGWDKKDVKGIGSKGHVACANCRAKFALPAVLVKQMAAIGRRSEAAR